MTIDIIALQSAVVRPNGIPGSGRMRIVASEPTSATGRRPLGFVALTTGHGPGLPTLAVAQVVGYLGYTGHRVNADATAVSDPHVWSGRASQEVSSIWGLCGLASMYPASDWSGLCSGPSWISARLRSHYRTGLERAIWVTRVRRRREDRSSISFHPLADLGRKTGTTSSLSP